MSGSARRGHVQAGLRHERQQPRALERHRLAARVGAGDDEHPRRRDQHEVHRHGRGRRRRVRLAVGDQRAHRRHEQRVPRRAELEPAVGGQRGLDAVAEAREARFGLDDVQLHGRLDRARQLRRPAAEGVGEPEEDAADLVAFLLLERDDLVVDLDRAQGLEVQARAARRGAVHDAGDGGAVLGADHQDVAPVAVGDDLVLQVLRRLPAAQERLQRAAQARPLLAQPVPDDPQLRARVVGHLARLVDLPADVGDLALERRGGVDERRELGQVAAGPADRGPGRVDRRQEAAELDERRRLEQASLDGEGGQDAVEARRRREREVAVLAQIGHALAGRCERRGDRPGVGQRTERAQPFSGQRRRGQAAHRLHDTVEFEGPQGARVHRACLVFGEQRQSAILQPSLPPAAKAIAKFTPSEALRSIFPIF